MWPQPEPDYPRPRPDVDPPKPDPKPALTDKQRLDQFRQEVSNYPQWDASHYQSAIAGTFNTLVLNNKDYMAAIYDAASQNKPVVMLFGRGSDPASRQLIENSMRQSHAANGKDALYVFVDMDRVDRNSAIGKYAFENMPAKGQEPPFTMVFGLSRGDSASNPVTADAPSFYHMGPVDPSQISEAVSRLRYQMDGRFNLPQSHEPHPDVNPNPVPGPGQLDPRVQEAFSRALLAAQQQTDHESAYKDYKQAVDIADYAGNPLLQSAARVELGLACIRWGFKETGFKWIMEGGDKNHELYDSRRNAPFIQRLSQTGIPDQAIELLILNGQQNPDWYKSNPNAGKILEAVTNAALNPRPQPQPRPQDYPLDRPGRNPVPPFHLMPSPFG